MPNRLHQKTTSATAISAATTLYDSGGDGGFQIKFSVDGEVFATLGNFSIRPASGHAHDEAGGDYACLMLLGNGAGTEFNAQLRSDNGSHQQWTAVALRSAFTVGTNYTVAVHWDGSGNEQLSIVAEDGTVIYDDQPASGGGALPSLTGIKIDCAPSTAPLQNQNFQAAWVDGCAVGPSSIGILTGTDRYEKPTSGWTHVWEFDESGTTTTVADEAGSVDITVGGAFTTDVEWVGGGFWAKASTAASVSAGGSAGVSGTAEFAKNVPVGALSTVGSLGVSGTAQATLIASANGGGSFDVSGSAEFSAVSPFTAVGSTGVSGTAEATAELPLAAAGSLGVSGTAGFTSASAPVGNLTASGALGVSGSAEFSVQSMETVTTAGALGVSGRAEFSVAGSLEGLGVTLGMSWYVAGAYAAGSLGADPSPALHTDYDGLAYHQLRGVVGATVTLTIYVRNVPGSGLSSAVLVIKPRSDLDPAVTKNALILDSGQSDGIAKMTFTLDPTDTIAIGTSRFLMDVDVASGSEARTPMVGTTRLTLA